MIVCIINCQIHANLQSFKERPGKQYPLPVHILYVGNNAKQQMQILVS